MRFAVINLVRPVLRRLAQGLGRLLIQADTTHQVLLIALVFAYGLVRCGEKVLITSIEINQISDPQSAGSSSAKLSGEHQPADAHRARSAPRRSR